MEEEKQSYRRQSGCEAAYKMKKAGMREVLKYFVYAVRRMYGILYKITFAFDGLYF